MVKKNTIPEGWRAITPVGQRIPETRFIAFKVPLKGSVNQRLTPQQKFTPKDLISLIKAQNEELGLIIDLTNTTRYYEEKDLPKSVQYKKLFTVGLEVPDDPTILQFKRTIRKFLWENTDNDKLIGVHCTNGVNRTGYLICRYLIDVEGWDPETAIQAFGEARGHIMDGTVYLNDLQIGPFRNNLGMDVFEPEQDPAACFISEPDFGLLHDEFIGPGPRCRPYYDLPPYDNHLCSKWHDRPIRTPPLVPPHLSSLCWDDRPQLHNDFGAEDHRPIRIPPVPPPLSRNSRQQIFCDGGPEDHSTHRSNYLWENRRIRPSEEFNRGGHHRFMPYSLRPQIPQQSPRDHFREYEKNPLLCGLQRDTEQHATQPLYLSSLMKWTTLTEDD
ncbi:RNA/RNP complex-1-interacting phosphatase isoform X2 [Latimeria chalumnae]|uniref:RNA/RNP complex-1-interacting phosphatase isoform X2 n=1 Tax=Latimeria chalumnae TaxID=7897 RepID=UPI0003C1558F